MMGQTKAKVPLASVGRSGWDTLSESRKNLRRKRYTREHMRIIWASRHCIRGPEGATLLADHIDHPRVFQKPNLRHKYAPPRRTVRRSGTDNTPRPRVRRSLTKTKTKCILGRPRVRVEIGLIKPCNELFRFESESVV